MRLRDDAPILPAGERRVVARSGTVNMMYRVLAIFGGALALAACSSTPDWMSLDGLKPGPSLDTVSFESEPPGAEAKASNGQSCRTPCSLALPVDAASSVTFTLNGYLPEFEDSKRSQRPVSRPGCGQIRLSSSSHQVRRRSQRSRLPRSLSPRNRPGRSRPLRQPRLQLRPRPRRRQLHRGRQTRRRRRGSSSRPIRVTRRSLKVA